MYDFVKILHASCAVLSVLGFSIRGGWKLSGRNLPTHFAVRVLPHIIDTVLLLSAIILVVSSGQYPFVVPWVTAKLLALIVYIGSGILFMRSESRRNLQVAAFALALATAVYLFSVAFSKSPIPW